LKKNVFVFGFFQKNLLVKRKRFPDGKILSSGARLRQAVPPATSCRNGGSVMLCQKAYLTMTLQKRINM